MHKQTSQKVEDFAIPPSVESDVIYKGTLHEK